MTISSNEVTVYEKFEDELKVDLCTIDDINNLRRELYNSCIQTPTFSRYRKQYEIIANKNKNIAADTADQIFVGVIIDLIAKSLSKENTSLRDGLQKLYPKIQEILESEKNTALHKAAWEHDQKLIDSMIEKPKVSAIFPKKDPDFQENKDVKQQTQTQNQQFEPTKQPDISSLQKKSWFEQHTIAIFGVCVIALIALLYHLDPDNVTQWFTGYAPKRI